MRRVAIALVLVAVLVTGYAVSAGGQAGPPTGTETLELRFRARDIGVNCANRPPRACERSIRLANLNVGSGRVLRDGNAVGAVVFSNIRAKQGRNGLDIFMARLVLNNGMIVLEGVEAAQNVPHAVTGGTGAYAGARGTASDVEIRSEREDEFRLRLTLTFLP